jgi:acyl-CoA thioesterase I
MLFFWWTEVYTLPGTIYSKSTNPMGNLSMRALHTLLIASLAGCATVDPALTRSVAPGAGWSLEPFWATTTMHEESVLFIQETPDAAPQASLLFTPRSILLVEQPGTGILMETGRDYTLSPDKRTLSLTPSSRIPFTTRDAMYPPSGAAHSIAAKRDSDRHLLFSEGRYFHDLQVEVSYTHSGREWRERGGYVPRTTPRHLQGSKVKLKRGSPFRLIVLGDSISAGANASATTGAPPFMPPYGLLVAHGLEAYYKREIQHENVSVGGKTSAWGVEVITEVARQRPDLLVIAFGMNDASERRPAAEFQRNVQQMMDEVLRLTPAAEFILVATMAGNPEWTASSSEHYLAYRDKLLELESDSVAVADMTSIWVELLKHKTFADITGNGVNHPNDFGHRLYAQVILSLLTEAFLPLPALPAVPRL